MANCACYLKDGRVCYKPVKPGTKFCGRHQNCTNFANFQQQAAAHKKMIQQIHQKNRVQGKDAQLKRNVAFMKSKTQFLGQQTQPRRYLLQKNTRQWSQNDEALFQGYFKQVAQKSRVVRLAQQQAAQYPKWREGLPVSKSSEGGKINAGDAFWEVTNWTCGQKRTVIANKICSNQAYRNYFLTTKELLAYMGLSQGGVLMARIRDFLGARGIQMFELIKDFKWEGEWDKTIKYLPEIMAFLHANKIQLKVKDVFDPYFMDGGYDEPDIGNRPIDLCLHFS
jgi:hypothetical protein